MTLKLHPLAENDLKTALDYYFEISPNLETRFLSSIDRQFHKILEHPKVYPFETKTSQKVIVNKFPYIIIFEQYKDIIIILAIFHTRQNPKKLNDRHNS